MDFAVWSEDIMKSWKQAQQQYWNNISGQAESAETDKTSEIPGFTTGLEKWWTIINPLLPEQSNEAMKRVFDMGKSYSQFLDSAINAKGEAVNPLENWLDAMEKGFSEWSKLTTQDSKDFFQPPPGMNTLQGWQSILDSLKLIPEGELQTVNDLIEKYSEALQTYMKAFSVQGLDSLVALRTRMEKMSAEGASIDSLRELYELWIDIGEEVYSKFAMSKQHQEIYGDLVNTFSALKGGIDSIIEPQLKSLNILTQKDLDDVLKQLHQIKRENEVLREQLSNIEKQFAALEAKLTPTKPSQSAPKPAAKTAQSAPKPAAKTAQSAPKPAAKTAQSAPKPAAKTAQSAPKPAAKTAQSAPKSAAKTAQSAPKPAKPAAKPAPTATETATPKPVSPAAKTTKPTPKPVKAKPDDLTIIKGIGPKMNEKLIDAGIQTFDQLAALSRDQADAMDQQLDARGRLLREDWVGQAAMRANTKLA